MPTKTKYKHVFSCCQKSVYLNKRTVEKKVRRFFVEMENTLTGLCHYASNCYIFFHKGRIYSTGCKQLQVKGQRIYYPPRKGNAYIIQSASASHLDWTNSALVTLYTGSFHFKPIHNLLWTHFQSKLFQAPYHHLHRKKALSYSLFSSGDAQLDCPVAYVRSHSLNDWVIWHKINIKVYWTKQI